MKRNLTGLDRGTAIIAIAIVVLAVAYLAITSPKSEAQRQKDVGENSPATQPCAEDSPCFDCETMGNRQCGPATAVVDREGLIIVTGADGTTLGVVFPEHVVYKEHWLSHS